MGSSMKENFVLDDTPRFRLSDRGYTAYAWRPDVGTMGYLLPLRTAEDKGKTIQELIDKFYIEL
jgi:hypothetical protein